MPKNGFFLYKLMADLCSTNILCICFSIFFFKYALKQFLNVTATVEKTEKFGILFIA